MAPHAFGRYIKRRTQPLLSLLKLFALDTFGPVIILFSFRVRASGASAVGTIAGFYELYNLQHSAAGHAVAAPTSL